jgi:hypothetical protein
MTSLISFVTTDDTLRQIRSMLNFAVRTLYLYLKPTNIKSIDWSRMDKNRVGETSFLGIRVNILLDLEYKQLHKSASGRVDFRNFPENTLEKLA